MNKNGTLTTNTGAPIYDTQNSLTIGNEGPVLLEDAQFVEKIAHFDRERIPERVVHAKGNGAFGYFAPYQSMSEYTSASFLQEPSKKTKVLVRFSTVIGSRGSADTVRDPRGFAVRFYTDEGNYDVAGLSFPVFFIRDAMSFPDFIHSQKPDPRTNIRDFSRIWDFFSLKPECAHALTWLYSDRGIVKDYRKMDGFGVNTFVWVNKCGRRRYVKYHFLGQAGKEVVDRFEGERLAGEDPDIAGRNLYSSISRGCPAKYEFCVQMMDPEMACQLAFDPLDDTKTWPQDQFPLMKVGMLVFNENPVNFFAEIEQAAFAPSNIVPGIEFSADKMLQGRIFSYHDTQRYRIGTNFAQLPVNRPAVQVCNDQRDGSMSYAIPEGGINYKPNALADNYPRESCRPSFPGMYFEGNVMRQSIDKTDNFSQACARYTSLPEPEKNRMAEAMAFELCQVNAGIQERSFKLLADISKDLCCRVQNYMKQNSVQKHKIQEKNTMPCPKCRSGMMTRQRYMKDSHL